MSDGLCQCPASTGLSLRACSVEDCTDSQASTSSQSPFSRICREQSLVLRVPRELTATLRILLVLDTEESAWGRVLSPSPQELARKEHSQDSFPPECSRQQTICQGLNSHFPAACWSWARGEMGTAGAESCSRQPVSGVDSRDICRGDAWGTFQCSLTPFQIRTIAEMQPDLIYELHIFHRSLQVPQESARSDRTDFTSGISMKLASSTVPMGGVILI